MDHSQTAPDGTTPPQAPPPSPAADTTAGQKATQERRARQYAICTIALSKSRSVDGAEGIFDQALTNGLAAIVAHAWPGKEANGKGFMLSASKLLDVIEANGREPVDDDGNPIAGAEDADTVVWVPHDPDGPLYDDAFSDWVDDLMPNFTVVQVGMLKDALQATQTIRHARDSGQDAGAALSDEHITALEALDRHPALSGVSEELHNRYEQNVAAVDRANVARAQQYLKLLGEDEVARRAELDYEKLYGPSWRDIKHGSDACVEECPVCGYESLVCEGREGLLGEIGIGQCLICSYERTAAVAEDQAQTVQLWRAVDRSD